jgi:propionyl-CoA synthetase
MGASRYHETYARWQADPEDFWAEVARDVDWYTTPTRIFDADAGVYGRWFVDGVTNTCWNAIDRHVEGGRAEQTALIYDSPITGTKASFTYREMKAEIEALAAVIADQGIVKGDRVLLYMPMVPQAAFAMLACARLGAIHSVVFGGFAARELASRIEDAKPKLVISASCGIEPTRIIAYKPLLDEALAMSRHKVERCIIFQREQQRCDLIPDRDLDYAAKWPACRSRPPTRFTCSTPPARPASPRAWCATMAGTSWRSSGR